MSEFNHNEFIKDEREKFLRRERNIIVERHRENDFFGSPSFLDPHGFYHSVRFAFLTVPFWILFVWWLAFLVGYPLTSKPGQAQTKIQKLPIKQLIKRQLVGGRIHKYNFESKEGEFLQVKVEQKDIDVIVKLFDENGKQLTEMDSPNGTQGFVI